MNVNFEEKNHQISSEWSTYISFNIQHKNRKLSSVPMLIVNQLKAQLPQKQNVSRQKEKSKKRSLWSTPDTDIRHSLNHDLQPTAGTSPIS